MSSRFPTQRAITARRSRRPGSEFACQSLALPCSDVCFVESDSDEEWSKCCRTQGRKENRRARSKTPEEKTQIKRESENSTESSAAEDGESTNPIERRQDEHGLRIKLAQTVAMGIPGVLNTQVCEVAVKLLWLSVFHSAASKSAQIFEYSTFLGPSLVPAYKKVTRTRSDSEVSHRLVVTAEFLKSCRIPAGISIAFRLVTHLMGNRFGGGRRGQQIVLSQIEGEGLRQSMSSMTSSIEDLYCTAQEHKPSTTLEATEIYRSVIHLFKCTLDWQPLQRCRKFSCRFDNSDTEIARYLLACDLLEARTEDEVERVFDLANKRLQESLNWANTFEFIREREIKHRWSGLVRWTKRLESGHPVLLMRLGAATCCCDGPKAEEYARAVITQVDRGVRKLLQNDGVDTLVTIVDCQGARPFNVNQYHALLRSIPVTLNRHYPARLKELHLVNVPGFVIWLIQLIKRFLHPATREKVFVYSDDISTFPPELLHILQAEAEHREAGAAEGSSSQSESASAQGGIHGEIVPASGAESSSPSPSSSAANGLNGPQPGTQALTLEKAIIRFTILFLFLWAVMLIVWSESSKVFTA